MGVDFVRYAESSAALLNADLTDRDAVVAHLRERAWLQSQVTDRDVVALRRFAKDLRAAFEASSRDDAQGVVDVLNELLLEHAELARQRRLEVLPVANELGVTSSPAVTRFRVLPGGGRPTEEAAPKVAHAIERMRDGLGGVLAEIEDLMTEQLGDEAPKKDEYASGFRAGMLEALETCYALLQAELLMSEGN